VLTNWSIFTAGRIGLDVLYEPQDRATVE